MIARPLVAVSLFGIPVGILGLAGAWSVGVRTWNLSPIPATAIGILGVVIWLGLVVLYAYKWYVYREAALREFNDPVQCSFVSLALISSMLVSSEVMHVSRAAGMTLLGVSIIAQ